MSFAVSRSIVWDTTRCFVDSRLTLNSLSHRSAPIIARGAGPQSFFPTWFPIFVSAALRVCAKLQSPSHLLLQRCQSRSSMSVSIVVGRAPLSDSTPTLRSKNEGLVPLSRLPRNRKAALASGSFWIARYNCLSHGRNLSGKGSSSSKDLRNGTPCGASSPVTPVKCYLDGG